MLFNMVAIEQPLASLGDYCTKPELAVDQRQVAHVLAVAESAPLLLVIRPCVLVPEQIEGVKQRLASPEQQVAELRLSMLIEADDFAVEHTATALQVASQSLAQSGEAFEIVSVPRDEPHAVLVGIKQRPETIPLDLEEPVWVREWCRGAG